MIKTLIIILLTQTSFLFAQQGIKRLTEMQKIFFVSESAGLASTSYNPAAMSIRSDNHGVIVGYDFDEIKIQGNTSVFFALGNIGISYQDVYNINNIRLQNYSVNLSIGNKYFSIGTINRYTTAIYNYNKQNKYSFDAGIILRPSSFLTFGLLARNLGEIRFESLNYIRNYTAGIGLTFLDQTLDLYADINFQDNSKADDIAATIGLVIVPLNLLEFRGGVSLNPDDIIYLRENDPKIINLKYEAFLSAGFLIKDAIRITVGSRFNDKGEQARFFTVLGFPLSKSK